MHIYECKNTVNVLIISNWWLHFVYCFIYFTAIMIVYHVFTCGMNFWNLLRTLVQFVFG